MRGHICITRGLYWKIEINHDAKWINMLNAWLSICFVQYSIESPKSTQLWQEQSQYTIIYTRMMWCWCVSYACAVFSSFVYIINYNIMCLCVYRRTHTPFDTSKKSRRRRCRTVRFSLHVQNLKYRIHKWEKISLELLYLHVCVRPFIFKCL